MWNLGYNDALHAALPTGVIPICYADDTVLIAGDRDWTRTIRLRLEVGIAALGKKIANLGLEMAAQKTEAIWFHNLPRNKRPPPSWIAVGGDRITVGRSLKYLGLILDERLNFENHFKQIAPKIEKAALGLGRIMPNIGGPKARVRRLYTAVVQSMALYEASIWANGNALTRKSVDTLRSVQRRMAIRLCRAYRTTPGNIAIAMAGMIPFDHQAGAYSEIYWTERDSDGRVQEAARSHEEVRTRATRRALHKWKSELQSNRAANKETVRAILANWEAWMEMSPPRLTYRISQALIEHGCIGEYLKRIGAEATAVCHQCGASHDTVQHTIEVCEAFAEYRNALKRAIGPDVSIMAIIKALVSNEEKSGAVATYYEEVFTVKEADERDREAKSRP